MHGATKNTSFTIGIRISCNLSPTKSPSALSYALSSQYTSRSSSNSSASGNASFVASLGEIIYPQRRPLLLLQHQQCSMAWLEVCARWQLPQQALRSHRPCRGHAHHHRPLQTASQVKRRRIPSLRRQHPLRSPAPALRAAHASHSPPCHLWPKERLIQAKWKANARRSSLGTREE